MDVFAEDKTYIINENEAVTVKIIFDLYTAGYGYKVIISRLKERGHKTKTGKDFKPSGLYEILNNEKYTGIYIFNRTLAKKCGKRNNHQSKSIENIIRIPGGMPEIISSEIFEQVKIKMTGRKTNARNKAIETYLLSGKIYCGICGATMLGHTSKSGRNKTKHSTYNCGERYRTKNCMAKAINRDFVEKIVINDLKEKLLNPKAIDNLAVKVLDHYQKTKNVGKDDIKVFQKKINEINKKLENIAKAIADGMYNKTMKESMDKFEQEKAEIETHVAELQSKTLIDSIDKKMVVNFLTKNLERLNNKNPDDLKIIIEAYVDRVNVYEEHIDVLLVVHMNGGGEPLRKKVSTTGFSGLSNFTSDYLSRTPVRKNDENTTIDISQMERLTFVNALPIYRAVLLGRKTLNNEYHF